MSWHGCFWLSRDARWKGHYDLLWLMLGVRGLSKLLDFTACNIPNRSLLSVQYAMTPAVVILGFRYAVVIGTAVDARDIVT